MKASSLHDIWGSPDNTRLTPKQFSFRLPIHVAAKIGALCNMYPQKSRTQIISDLLTSALDDLERNLPMELGDSLSYGEDEIERQIADHEQRQYEQVYHLGGVRAKFRWLSNQFFEEMEKELGNEKPTPLFPEMYVTEADLKK